MRALSSSRRFKCLTRSCRVAVDDSGTAPPEPYRPTMPTAPTRKHDADSTVDFRIVRLQELLDILRRRVAAGLSPTPGATPQLKEWVKRHLTAAPMSREEITQLAREFLFQAGASSDSSCPQELVER